MCVGRISERKVEKSNHAANREIAIYYMANALGIHESEVTNKIMLGHWVHYVVWSIFFRTGFSVQVHDLGTVTVGDILEQL